ncbi:fmn-binding split barrel-related protein [Rutstroemia sp. NJR-2017a BVV2]|nr:fmn-binding split barrel-related protein [Rutstroemia sp. NJR-2017a BVV2]
MLPAIASCTSIPDSAPDVEYIFSNPPSSDETINRIPTSRESAILARRILHLTPLGTISTVC